MTNIVLAASYSTQYTHYTRTLISIAVLTIPYIGWLLDKLVTGSNWLVSSYSYLLPIISNTPLDAWKSPALCTLAIRTPSEKCHFLAKNVYKAYKAPELLF